MKMKMKRRVIDILVVIVLSCVFPMKISLAQSLPFKHFTFEDGLPSSSVSPIIQDSRGFLWIGTTHGLSRFNGIEFENFKLKDGLIDDFILEIYEDGKGNIWIGTLDGGAACFFSGEFTSYTIENGLAGNRVMAIAADQEGHMWFGTNSGVSTFNGKDFITYTTKEGLIHDYVTEITLDKEGNLWFGTQKGLSCFTKNRFINYTTTRDDIRGLISDQIEVIMTDRRGNLWIGTQGGLCCKRRGASTFTSYTTKDGMADNCIRTMVEDRNGNIWIGTDNGASYFSSGKFSNYNTTHGLLNDRLYAVFEDLEGNIWFGTAMGLSKLNSLGIVNFYVRDGLPNNLVWAIIEDSEGRYWFGTDKGLSCYSNGTFKNFTTEDGLADNSIYTLLEDRTGKIWIGTNGGLSVYSPPTWANKGKDKGIGKFRNYTISSGLPDNSVISLVEDMNGVIWIGTAKGICRFINGAICPPNFLQEPRPIHALFEDRKGNLWFSDQKGLCKVAGDKKIHYSVQDGLIFKRIYSIWEDSRGRIWIGTSHGLSCFSNGQFTSYKTEDGLSDNVCYFVLEDDKRNLWIGTAKGVNRFNGKSFKPYTSRDGLASDDMVEGACLKDSQGYLWFGTAKGVSRFDSKFERVNTVPPPVYITNFSVLGKEYPMSDCMHLKHNQNYLKFDFIGISFTSPEDVIYKCRLKGIDPDWFELQQRYISYPYLPPGNYSFSVIAVNNDGIESIKPAEIRFRILPPFWQTWWFQALSVLFILFLIVMVLLWRIQRVKEKIAAQERNKQLVMAQKMELLGILASGAVHDLKNLLAIIIGYSKIAVQHVDQEDATIKPIENIKRTAVTAVQVVKQMLAFTRQTYDKTMAANLPDLLDDILEILKVTTPPKVKILWEPPKEEVRLYINPTKFQQLVMNLCLNAVQAMPKEGELNMRLYKAKDRDNQVVLEISDTGSGMEKENLVKIFDPLFTTKEPGKGTGLGLFVVKQIVDEYKGTIEVRSQPGEGATFKISFPQGPIN
jgi:ligand-binding sensor domain-containing protein/signal transduction histidine kinase